MKKTIVTIGRQYGSGGREIGRRLAEKLGIPFYDKKLIEMAAKESGMDPEVFAHVDETATNSLLYALSMGNFAVNSQTGQLLENSINDRVFFAVADYIRKVAEKGSCVIVGRCADYILRERTDTLNIFIHADLEHRIQRVKEEYGKEHRVEELIRKIDKQRANYYNYYSSQKWGNLANYDLVLDTGKFGIDGAVAILDVAIENL